MKCPTCPVAGPAACVAETTRCPRLCELAATNQAYRALVLAPPRAPAQAATPPPSAAPAAPAEHPGPSDLLARVLRCPHRGHCGCSIVRCQGGKRHGERVGLLDCERCLGAHDRQG